MFLLALSGFTRVHAITLAAGEGSAVLTHIGGSRV